MLHRPLWPRIAMLVTVAGLLAGVTPVLRAAESPVAERHLVAMRDGVRLATDVYPGEGPPPWPVILIRTPYGAKNSLPGRLTDYARVVQDVRGRFDSEGHAFPFLDDACGERQDGLDTVKWILAQPWCNGKIGTIGASAPGITQEMLAATNPPGVAAQHIRVAGGDVYDDLFYPGGVFTQNLTTAWLKLTQWPEDVLPQLLAHPFHDDFWRAGAARTRMSEQRISIPALHIGGWFDIFTQGTLDTFVARSKVAPNQWLVMGPWPHGITREVGALTFPENALRAPQGGTDDPRPWFDYWLKGQANGMAQIPHVQYYVMGACGEPGAPGNEWRSAETWPIPARLMTLYFTPDGRLSDRAPARETRRSYYYDPARPVPTLGGANLFMKYGSLDQRPVERRGDVMVFSTAVLQQPVEVTGRIVVHLRAASSARDTVFTAKLTDVYPDGRSMLIADGALRAACRVSVGDPTPLAPDRVYSFAVPVGSTSIIFNRGHRIRVAISSSNAPRFAVHPNVWGEGSPQRARQTVCFGGRQGSAVALPVVEMKQ